MATTHQCEPPFIPNSLRSCGLSSFWLKHLALVAPAVAGFATFADRKTMATVPPEAVEEWFQLMPNLLSSEGWAVALARPKANLSHTACPWGGHLIRFNLKDLTIQNPPEKTCNILVRPEVRALFQKVCPMKGNEVTSHEFIAPGEAILTSSTSWKLLRLVTVLFGDIAGAAMDVDVEATAVFLSGFPLCHFNS